MVILCGRAEQSPAPTGWGCKREIQGNKKGIQRKQQGDIKKQKGDAKGKGKRKGKERKKKRKTGSIGNHKRKRSFLGKA